MSTQLSTTSPLITDVLPWPGGHGFTVADTRHSPLPGQTERDRLDTLMGQALLDPGIRERLLVQRDPSLLDAFELSDDTRRWLTSLRANNLKEFAQAVLAASLPRRERAVPCAL